MTDVESRVTVVESGLRELRDRVEKFTPLVADVAVLNSQMTALREDLADYAKNAQRDRDNAALREAERARQRTASRQWLIGILIVVVLGLITASVELVH